MASGEFASEVIDMTGYQRYSGNCRSPFAPDSGGPDVQPERAAALLSASERHQLIAEAAYLIAKRRGFSPGQELSDWLAAEEEVDRACGLIEPSPRWDLGIR
jgi:hypothetical protein